jgi:hypothetical protein
MVVEHALIEEVLAAWDGALGAARAAYRGHAYRTFNVARRLFVGIWSDRTWDYLDPSVRRAREHLRRGGPGSTRARSSRRSRATTALRRAREGGPVEAFRRADLVDVSRGGSGSGWTAASAARWWRRSPTPASHGIRVRTALAWRVRHPLRPLPMLRL